MTHMIRLADLLKTARKQVQKREVEQDWIFALNGEAEIDVELKRDPALIDTDILSGILSTIKQLTNEKSINLDPKQEGRLAAFIYAQYLASGKTPDRDVVGSRRSYTAMKGKGKY